MTHILLSWGSLHIKNPRTILGTKHAILRWVAIAMLWVKRFFPMQEVPKDAKKYFTTLHKLWYNINIMNVIDIVLILVCLFFFVRAGIRGFIVEIFSLLAFIIGVIGAVQLFPFVVTMFKSSPAEASAVMKILIYGGIFLVLYILIKILERLLSKFVTVILLSGLNRVLGGALGLLEAMLVIQVLTTILINQEFVDFNFQSFFATSQILDYINTYLAVARNFLGI